MLEFLFAGAVALAYAFRKAIYTFFWGSSETPGSVEEESIALLQRNEHIPGRSREFSSILWNNSLTFFLNGEKVDIVNPDPDELLATYLREKRGLKGTKLGCEEGGCGACSVVIEYDNGHIVSANSCLRLLCANDGLTITTVEGIGSTAGGLSVEQSRLVANNGTQCGYCTPGWISGMHALLKDSEQSGRKLDPADIEKHFDGIH